MCTSRVIVRIATSYTTQSEGGARTSFRTEELKRKAEEKAGPSRPSEEGATGLGTTMFRPAAARTVGIGAFQARTESAASAKRVADGDAVFGDP